MGTQLTLSQFLDKPEITRDNKLQKINPKTYAKQQKRDFNDISNKGIPFEEIDVLDNYKFDGEREADDDEDDWIKYVTEEDHNKKHNPKVVPKAIPEELYGMMRQSLLLQPNNFKKSLLINQAFNRPQTIHPPTHDIELPHQQNLIIKDKNYDKKCPIMRTPTHRNQEPIREIHNTSIRVEARPQSGQRPSNLRGSYLVDEYRRSPLDSRPLSRDRPNSRGSNILGSILGSNRHNHLQQDTNVNQVINQHPLNRIKKLPLYGQPRESHKSNMSIDTSEQHRRVPEMRSPYKSNHLNIQR